MEKRSIMLPLEPLASLSPVERLILGARAPEAAAEIARLEALSHEEEQKAGRSGPFETSQALVRAARVYARGALAMREGSLGPAQADFEEAATAFDAAGDREAAEIAHAEGLLAKMRKGPRQAYAEAEAALATLAGTASTARVRVVALHYRGAALRLLGDAQETQRCLLEALALAGPGAGERPKILNSLGTLYVVMGAYGAAEALLEHAAEMHHQRGDSVGEAIACGQLGAAALGLGDLAKARTWLQRQEWLSSQVGDAFGRARALTFLADVALDVGRPDDAVELANLAREVARTTTPPLAVWLAYATRAVGRAKADLCDKTAEAELRDARERFTQIGNPLGLALTEWDLVRMMGEHVDGSVGSAAETGGARPLSWSGPAWALASLGLSARVAGLLRDHAEREQLPSERETARASGDGASGSADGGTRPEGPRADAEATFFAVAQPAPHLTVPREITLVYEAPAILGTVSNRRTAAQRNLARLGALTLAPPGLSIATVTWKGASGFRALPPERASCAAIGALPGVVQWAWPLAATDAELKRDVEGLQKALAAAGAESVSVDLVKQPRARVVSPPFAGEVAAHVELG
jgi:tetratricopeptide (TPR) repeat protein